LITGCQKTVNETAAVSAEETASKNVKSVKHFAARYLVSNVAGYGAEKLDPSLRNAWGLAWSATGTAWIGSQFGHVSNVYDSIGNPNATINPVAIPSPGGPTGGNPTGVVFNGGTGFLIPANAAAVVATTPARFIFVGVDGVLSAWSGGWGKFAYRKAILPGAFTGLAINTSGGNTYIYAANFATQNIDVWNSSWGAVAEATMPFIDPQLPAGYAPFNIQSVGSQLYVTYAKVGPDGRSQHGLGLGYVSIFTTDGQFVMRFASGGQLNAPWGITKAPASFYRDEDSDAGDAILVGNFGDGRILAYRASDGKFIGQLSNKKNTIVIDGLWAIGFAPATSTISQDILYFTAGPNQEQDGLFGYIKRLQED
jgi:uncharacterized protein (TIGR03118 family)